MPITKNAIKIAEKAKKQLDIDLFPYIQRIATKGFDVSGGTYAFCMRGEKDDWYFDCHAKYYLQKRCKNDILRYRALFNYT